MMDDFFDFDEHPENFYIVDEMVNEDNDRISKNDSCCSIFLVLGILTILIAII